jgi:hypothetical protein
MCFCKHVGDWSTTPIRRSYIGLANTAFQVAGTGSKGLPFDTGSCRWQ